MTTSFIQQGLIACAALACLASAPSALAKDEPAAAPASGAACAITARGVAQVKLGDTFKGFNASHAGRFGVYMDPETMAKFLMLFKSPAGLAAYKRDGHPDFEQVDFLVYFEDYGIEGKENDISDMRRLALPKDTQKIDRIEVRTGRCATAEGVQAGMRLKEAAARLGGLRHIDGGMGEVASFVKQPAWLGFQVDGAIPPKTDDLTWRTQRYRADATIRWVVIHPE